MVVEHNRGADMSGWRPFDPTVEAINGDTLWVHESGTDKVVMVTCDEYGAWHTAGGATLYSTAFNPDLCHDIVPPAPPEPSAVIKP